MYVYKYNTILIELCMFSLYEDKKIKGNVCKEIIKDIPQPILLIYPEKDFYVDEEEMEDLEEWLPNCGYEKRPILSFLLFELVGTTVVGRRTG